MVKRVPMEMIKRNHNGYWFSPDTLRFFKSRISQEAFSGPGGTFFVTSEKGPDEVRRYSVREAIDAGRRIETMGDSGAYRSRGIAQRAAIKAAKGQGQ